MKRAGTGRQKGDAPKGGVIVFERFLGVWMKCLSSKSDVILKKVWFVIANETTAFLVDELLRALWANMKWFWNGSTSVTWHIVLPFTC